MEAVSLQTGTSTNLATEELEDEDATEDFAQICSPQHQNLSDACVINLHYLTRFPDDILRFSAPDIFWCFQFERAVKRYVKQSSNKKHIEKSFARRECQREFLKFQPDLKLISSERTRMTWARDKEKVL